MDNQKLSERVEALEGPDRDVDQLIAIEHRSTPERRVIGVANCKPYTASLDAAMSLVPEGMWHEIKGPRRYLNIPTASPNYWSARLDAWDAGAEGMGWGATPAIALCAAALKARGL